MNIVDILEADVKRTWDEISKEENKKFMEKLFGKTIDDKIQLEYDEEMSKLVSDFSNQYEKTLKEVLVDFPEDKDDEIQIERDKVSITYMPIVAEAEPTSAIFFVSDIPDAINEKFDFAKFTDRIVKLTVLKIQSNLDKKFNPEDYDDVYDAFCETINDINHCMEKSDDNIKKMMKDYATKKLVEPIVNDINRLKNLSDDEKDSMDSYIKDNFITNPSNGWEEDTNHNCGSNLSERINYLEQLNFNANRVCYFVGLCGVYAFNKPYFQRNGIDFDMIYDSVQNSISNQSEIKEQKDNHSTNNNSVDTEKNIDNIVERMANGEDVLGEGQNQEQNTNNKQMGYTMVGLVGFIAGVLSVGIIILGVLIK